MTWLSMYVSKETEGKCTSSGVRPNQRSFKVGCPAKIRLVAVEENGICQLRVTTCHSYHSNHPVWPEIMKVFPEMRKPDSDNTLNKILALPSVSARDIQQYVQETQNKVLFNSDIHNLRRKVVKGLDVSETERIGQQLKTVEEEGGKFMFAINDTSELQYVAFITKTMLESITTYP
ncbi:hypothetical protein RRG08_000994 [Elysia crispata]|uniref:Uncharacterized protein n=1 Tax=Elysia crispata TaxID=231223 RepID=A0AAE1CM43_9GAST|nr:hypothetical protein RRG08_000994 [Elysia crispata]